MSVEKKVVSCPICRPQLEAEECVFVTVRKEEYGKTTICCCPQHEKVKEEEPS